MSSVYTLPSLLLQRQETAQQSDMKASEVLQLQIYSFLKELTELGSGSARL